MSKDQLLNTKGTNSESFSLGLGENKVEIRSIDGVLYFRNYQGAWERVATPVQAASAFILPWATGLAILENQAITYNGSIYIAETDFTAGSTFEDDILNFSKLTTYDHLSSYDTTVDSSPVSVNNTDANIFIFEGTGGTDPFEIRLPPIAQANFGATRIVINNSDSQISVKTSAGADLTPPLLLDIGESANLFITSSGDWLPFGSGGGSADTDLEVIQANSFSVGDVIAKDSGGNYVLATTSDNKLGLVSFADGSRFKVRLIGELDLTGHPSLPLTDGTLYYLSDTTAGEFTDTPPTESFPVFVAISTTSALILPYPQETLGGGGGGGEISRELLDLNDSFYKYNTQTKFLTDTDTLVDNGNTTATVSTSTVFNTAEKLTTENLISDLFLDEPVELSRVESVVRWAYGANLQDHVSRLRASRDGGNTWSNGYLQRQGLQLRAEATVLTQVTQTSEYAVNITTQQKIGQSFQLSKNTVVTKVALSLRKTGLVYGRYRYVIATDSTGPATVITYTDWQLISDLDATLIEKPLELLFPVFLNSATTYHAYIETESLNEYNYSAATRELVVGYANTNPYSGGSVFLFTGTWSASAGNDLAFTIYGKETANIGKSDNSIGNVTFTKNKSQRLISYPTASEDASIEINATTQQNLAESFLINKNFTIDLIRFRMLRTGSPGGQVYVEIYDDNGSGSPGAFRTSSLNRVNISSIGVSAQYVDFKFNDSALTAGNKYHAIIKVSAAYAYVAATNLLSVRSDNSSPLYLQGSLNTYNGSAWALDATKNLSFEVYGEIFDIPNSYDSSYELTTTLDIDDGTSRQKIAQSITPDNQYYLSSIDLLLKRTGSPGGTCYVEIFSDNGGVPNTLLYTSNSVTISNIGTTASFINFSFNDRFFLSSSTPYWISLTTSGYSYTNGVTEIEWINDTNIMNHVGGAALYNGSWGSNASVFVYRVNGIDADLKLEITAIKDSVEMTDLGVKFGFSNEFVSYDPLVNEVSLTSSMLTTGIVPHGLSVSNSKGSLSAILLGHEILSGIDFQTSDGYAIFDTDDLSGITSILFKKNESSVSFGSPELNSRELLRSLPLPTLTQIDEETIQLNSIGGVSTFRFDTPNGVSFGLDGTRISFNSSKNVNNTLTLDTGSEALSESYYLYAVRNGIGDKGELVISANPDGPTGYKYHYLVGTFFNSAAGDITNLKTNQNVTKVITTSISDWTPFTMTIDATTTAPTKATTRTETAYWRRVGDSMEITYIYNQTSATGAANGSGIYLYQLPAGYTADSSKVTISTSDLTATQVGLGRLDDGTLTNGYAVKAWLYNSTSIALITIAAGATSAGTTVSSSAFGLAGGANRTYHFTALVPIVGWSNQTEFDIFSTDKLRIEYAHNTDA
ncbi:MAG: hypothetical protein KDH96_06395, partial [Candidatus Riesia sp.]|nr:hypothetical protein [Candidatus Riesia sp.]